MANADLGERAAHRPDEHWALAGASLSLWWREAPTLPDERVGVIGHYEAADGDDAATLLAHACARLAAERCTIAVGPMDGNTWRRYRLLTERGAEPPFFLEPDNPDTFPAQWAAAGFEPRAGYSSALDADLARTDPRLARVRERAGAEGVQMRCIDPARLEDELGLIHDLSVAAFTRNFLYTPLDRADFVAQYLPIAPYLRPEFVRIAEYAGEAVGFIFAVPDMAQAQRGRPVDTLIVKTAAVLPGRRHAGLGMLLVEEVRAAARELGYTRAIYALMHDANNSRTIAGHYATTMRRYTLYAKRLQP